MKFQQHFCIFEFHNVAAGLLQMKLNYLWCVHREHSYESIGGQILKIGLHFLKLLSISSSILFETQCRMTQKLISESLDVVVKNTKDYFFYSKVISNTRRYSKQKTCRPFNSHSKIAEQRTIIQQYSDFIHFDAKLTRNGSLNEHYEQHLPLYLWSFLFFPIIQAQKFSSVWVSHSRSPPATRGLWRTTIDASTMTSI